MNVDALLIVFFILAAAGAVIVTIFLVIIMLPFAITWLRELIRRPREDKPVEQVRSILKGKASLTEALMDERREERKQ